MRDGDVYSTVARMWERARRSAVGVPTRNEALRAKLARQGDDPSVPRRVTHFLSAEPTGDIVEGREALCRLVQDAGYFVLETTRTTITFVASERINSTAFDNFTADLRRRAHILGWGYDGWDCAPTAASPRRQRDLS